MLTSNPFSSSVSEVASIPGLSSLFNDAHVNREREIQPVYVLQYDNCLDSHGVIVRDIIWKKVPTTYIVCRNINTFPHAFTEDRGHKGIQQRREPFSVERGSQFSLYGAPPPEYRTVTISLSGPLQGQFPSEQLNREILYVVAADNNYALAGPERKVYQNVALDFLSQSTSIVVVALDKSGQSLAFYSSRCGWAKEHCIAAPGAVLRTNGTMTYGTSFATPLVTSVAATLFQYWPEISAIDVKGILFQCARDLGAKGIDSVYGHGGLSLGERGSDNCLINNNLLDNPVGEKRTRSLSSLEALLVAYHRQNIATLGNIVPRNQGWSTISLKKPSRTQTGIRWKTGALFITLESHTYYPLTGKQSMQGIVTTGYAYQSTHRLWITALTRTSYTTSIPTSLGEKNMTHRIGNTFLTQMIYKYRGFALVFSTGIHVSRHHDFVQNHDDISVFLHTRVGF